MWLFHERSPATHEDKVADMLIFRPDPEPAHVYLDLEEIREMGGRPRRPPPSPGEDDDRSRGTEARRALALSERWNGAAPRPGSVQPSPIFSASMKAVFGISTLPNWRMRFLPSFCLSRSLRLRVTSPP